MRAREEMISRKREGAKTRKLNRSDLAAGTRYRLTRTELPLFQTAIGKGILAALCVWQYLSAMSPELRPRNSVTSRIFDETARAAYNSSVFPSSM
jgi:hypothetical protein